MLIEVCHITICATNRMHCMCDALLQLPKASFPVNIGVMADPGQTYNTSVMLDHLRATNPELVLLVGDFTYADEWLTLETRLPDGLKYTYQPKWDTWSRLFQPLLSHVPVIHTNGNHEIEQQPSGVRNTAYNYRFPTPQKSSEGITASLDTADRKPQRTAGSPRPYCPATLCEISVHVIRKLGNGAILGVCS
eukprot:GHUV01046052.1.p1 GENE.GHUV01046052.1~~GHUV01046052.1.p1  ORF type:complete len:192 (+),score=20.32 GHUV01046052.1:1236-1811(+)